MEMAGDNRKETEMKKILNVLCKVELVVCSVAMCVMVFLAAGNVIARKLFNSSWSFTEELTCALFIFITMLGAGMLSRSNGHISLDIVTNLLPKPFHKPLVALTMIVVSLVSVVLIVSGIRMVISEIRSGQTTPALHIKEWIYGMTIPVGAFFILVHSLEWCIQELRKKGE